MIKIYNFPFTIPKMRSVRLGLMLTISSVFCGQIATASAGSGAVTNAGSGNFAAPVADGAYMVLKNMDNFPANDKLVFSRIEIPWRKSDTTEYNANHDKVRLRIQSKGSESLVINSLVLSNKAGWKIASVGGDATPSFPKTITTGNYLEVVVQFIAEGASTRVTILQDKLTINSNDNLTPVKDVALMGLYQKQGEGQNEPYASEIIKAFDFKSNPGYGRVDNGVEGKTIMPNSDEVAASYFVRADPNKPVTVYQLAAYHGCCGSVETIRYYTKGSTTMNTLFTHHVLDAQSLLPRLRNSSSTLAVKTIDNPTEPFGFRVSNSRSDRMLNFNDLIGLRILKAVDAAGYVIPNAYIMNMDYIDNSATNFDYQDNIYYIDNIKPETGTVHYSDLASVSGSAIQYDATTTGTTQTKDVTLKNMGKTYDDNSKDPSVTIKSARIIGPNASEFSVASLSTTLEPQATATLSVKFNPKTQGIKNAVMVVYYTNANSPLRIPLYGNAHTASSAVEIVKRIKGGSDSNVTIDGQVFESDKNYRVGSVRNDAQVVKTEVAGTDMDELYQTYLSASADLQQTGYNIPVANGDYMVRMHFVENYFSEQGSRVFGGTMEGKQILTNLDIFNEVGYRTAIVKDFNTSVSDGVLNMRFTPTANRLALAGVEIFRINDNPLPVTLVSFDANKVENTTLLSWKTSFETNSSNFEIQRSKSGQDWEILGSVDAAGESRENYSYSFVDSKPLSGNNLYRLKMIDLDGTSTFSKWINLNFDIVATAQVFPNPVVDKLNLDITDWSQISAVQLYNITGKAVYEARNTPVTSIDVKNLPSGMYVMHITRNNGNVVTYKIVKN
ncbi:T9SS type A sorting domain-containing protein [Dyadobacter flavalbus]|uniref:T9SS type A sorting domain-containing protein n=1 Tax=Dyadobacter flavalbus TaxID=2579942 RepID=A0A5M8QYG6_9BACT|nr:malectin domain-containing carbohydrate-binding protein [Dyadobacter flavalbus]KAA6439042.1 T9SS type A sorting domain-containing protein [Dyadobacter flavalbus]